MPPISRRRALTYAAVLLAVLALGGRYALAGEDTPAEPSSAPVLEAAPAPRRMLVVHVVGAVRRPGLYRLAEGSRIDDAIREAGGPRPRAAVELVNLAAEIADGQQIVVPARDRSGAPAASPPGAAGLPAAGGKVHLNSATLEELDALPGVGPVTAQRILDFRAAHGAFSSVEELDAVPGIGPARLEQLKPLVEL